MNFQDPATPKDFSEGSMESLQAQQQLERMRSEQNLPMGIVGGFLGAAVGAALWGAITYFTSFQIGWMAVGVGILAGLGVRWLGKGFGTNFSLVGAAWALLGCLAGNLLAVCGFIAGNGDGSFVEVLSSLDFATTQQLMVATFSPIDLLFYGFAVWEGFKFAPRKVTAEDLGLAEEPVAEGGDLKT